MSTAWIIVLCIGTFCTGLVLGVIGCIALGGALTRSKLGCKKEVDPDVKDEVFLFVAQFLERGEQPAIAEVHAKWGMQGVRAWRELAVEFDEL